MTPLQRFPAAVAFLALLALPVASQGKPSPKVPPSTKNTPPAEDAPPVKKTPKLAAKHIETVKKKKPMTVEAKVEVLTASGIQADAGDLGEPMTVSVRNPFTTKASLSFLGTNMVLPNQGVAVLGELNNLANHDGNGTIPTEVGVAAVILRFRAAPETGYIVECLASGNGRLQAHVIVDRDIVGYDEGRADGSYELYVPRGPRRDVRIDLDSEMPWTLRQCQLTPVRV